MRAKKIYLRPSYHIRLDCIDWLLFVSTAARITMLIKMLIMLDRAEELTKDKPEAALCALMYAVD